jgi:hypothetical protein
MPTRKKTQLGDSDMEHTGDAATTGLVRPTKRNTENIDAPTTDFSGIPYFTATSTFLQNNGIFIYTKGLEDTFLSANHSTLAHNSRLYYETNVLHTPLVDKNADDAKMDTKSKRQRNRESGKHNLVDRVDDLNWHGQSLARWTSHSIWLTSKSRTNSPSSIGNWDAYKKSPS